jgi:hypothetical protein
MRSMPCLTAEEGATTCELPMSPIELNPSAKDTPSSLDANASERTKYRRVVVGYHGCDAQLAQRVLAGECQLLPSTNEHDWLWHGIYFWEFGYDRAVRWAQERAAKRGVPGAVLGAVIELGACFDLLDTRATRERASWAEILAGELEKLCVPLPRNTGGDFKARKLDCAIINYTLKMLSQQGTTYQTVRCGFVEGPPVFERGAVRTAIQLETHIQVAVREPQQIVKFFPGGDDPPI